MAKKNIFTRFFSRKESLPKQTEIHSQPESTHSDGWQPIITRSWNGEKTPGELGSINVNVPDFVRLRYRSYDAAVRIDTVKIIAGKFFKYVIGGGLKLQAEPNEVVLSTEGITENFDKFKLNVEARFNVFSNSKNCSQDKRNDLHDLAMNAFKSAFLGGDCLCVLRVKDNNLTVQIIDGEHIVTPWLDSNHLKAVKDRGNFCSNGVEYSKTGEHIGFFVSVKSTDDYINKIQYIKATGTSTGSKVAWMIYGEKQRADHHRGVPKLSSILEKVNKLDRYVEAAVGKAEEAAKLIMGIEHNADSTGENPFTKVMTKKLNMGTNDVEEKTSFDLADGIANKINQTTNKTVVNLPTGAKLSSFDTNIETTFDSFYNAVFSSACASADLPPEVALQKYDSNYSASRAAIGAWEFITDITRDEFSKNFYKIIYKRWLELEVLKNKISAPGFVPSLKSKDFMVIESYSACKFSGKKMPHIDPLKEIKAVRLMLGDDNTPLASREQATEYLNLGDWLKNFNKFQAENKSIPKPKEPIEK